MAVTKQQLDDLFAPQGGTGVRGMVYHHGDGEFEPCRCLLGILGDAKPDEIGFESILRMEAKGYTGDQISRIWKTHDRAVSKLPQKRALRGTREYDQALDFMVQELKNVEIL